MTEQTILTLHSLPESVFDVSDFGSWDGGKAHYNRCIQPETRSVRVTMWIKPHGAVRDQKRIRTTFTLDWRELQYAEVCKHRIAEAIEAARMEATR